MSFGVYSAGKPADVLADIQSHVVGAKPYSNIPQPVADIVSAFINGNPPNGDDLVIVEGGGHFDTTENAGSISNSLTLSILFIKTAQPAPVPDLVSEPTAV